MRARAPAALALAAALAGGCGTSQNDPAEKAQATVETLLESCARDDAIPVEHLLTEPVAERFIKAGSPVEGCRRILALPLPRHLPESLTRSLFQESDVQRAEANAGFASVVVATETGTRSELLLELRRGVWQVSNPVRSDTPPPPG